SQARDASGNPVSQAGVTVTAAIATGSGTLGCTLAATTTGTGVATVVNLAVTRTAGDRTLSFSATGLTGVNSATVTITAGTATQLTVTTQPSETARADVCTPDPRAIQIRAATGNPMNQSGVTVTAGIATGGGPLGG